MNQRILKAKKCSKTFERQCNPYAISDFSLNSSTLEKPRICNVLVHVINKYYILILLDIENEERPRVSASREWRKKPTASRAFIRHAISDFSTPGANRDIVACLKCTSISCIRSPDHRRCNVTRRLPDRSRYIFPPRKVIGSVRS